MKKNLNSEYNKLSNQKNIPAYFYCLTERVPTYTHIIASSEKHQGHYFVHPMHYKHISKF